jgi:hypothetical protein
MFFYFCTTGYNACTGPSEDPCTEPFGGDGCFMPVISFSIKMVKPSSFYYKLGRFSVCVHACKEMFIQYFLLEPPILHVFVKLVGQVSLQLSNTWG